jgi:hypothetical protein
MCLFIVTCRRGLDCRDQCNVRSLWAMSVVCGKQDVSFSDEPPCSINYRDRILKVMHFLQKGARFCHPAPFMEENPLRSPSSYSTELSRSAKLFNIRALIEATNFNMT